MDQPDHAVSSLALSEALATNGWLTVDSILSSSEVQTARVALDELFEAEADIADDRGWHNEIYRVSYAIIAKHPALFEIALRPKVVALARDLIGTDCVLASANGIDIMANSTGQRLHRDHRETTPGRTLYLHIVCALDSFRTETGATLVVNASHRQPLAERSPDEISASEKTLRVEVAPGATVVFDGCVVHGAGPNSTSERRRALHLFFAKPWVQPHWDFPAMFAHRESELTDDQRQLLGFNSRPRRFNIKERIIES